MEEHVTLGHVQFHERGSQGGGTLGIKCGEQGCVREGLIHGDILAYA
jgi:hypothetical protein